MYTQTLAPGDSPPSSSGFSSLEVYEKLRQRILVNAYKFRQRLKEEELARELRVSRTPVRQALTMLEAEGLVELTPNKGAIVCGYTVDDVRQIYDLRVLLEGHAARLATARITPPELEGLSRLVEEMAEFDPAVFPSREDAVRWIAARNQQYHQTIVIASQNRHLEKLVRRTVQTPLVFKSFYWYTLREFELSNYYHRTILQALEQKEAERAETLMRAHIFEGRDVVIRTLERDLP